MTGDGYWYFGRCGVEPEGRGVNAARMQIYANLLDDTQRFVDICLTK